MSFMNDANDLAYQLCKGRDYRTNEPLPPIKKITFERHEIVTITGEDGFAETAERIEQLLLDGFVLRRSK